MLKISPQLIPHSEFHKGVWLFSLREPGWYYFMKKKNPNHIHNADFSESLDEPLKELVTYLQKKNIRTTPSCSGHHISERDLSKFYRGLEEDRRMICGEGLYLKDVESGGVYFLKDKDYTLPWSKDEFIDKLEKYQGKGVLGIRFGNRRKIRQNVLQMKVPGARLNEKDGITFIFTGEDTDEGIAEVWSQITEKIKTIVD